MGKELWQFEFEQDRKGLRFRGARLNSHGYWRELGEIPAVVRQFLMLDDAGFCEAFHTIEEIREGAQEVKWHQVTSKTIKGCFEIEVSDLDQPWEKTERALAVERYLREMNPGRCDSFLYSFDWKDADLEPEGCGGIKEILGEHGGRIGALVNIHATLCDPTYESEWPLSAEEERSYREAAHEIVCGCGVAGMWSGDDWSMGETFTITARCDQNPRVLAKRLIRKAEKDLAPIRKELRWANEELDRLYRELRDRYERKEA